MKREFPEKLMIWMCPDCGRIVTRPSYSVDERRSKCTANIHTTTLVGAWYRCVKAPPPPTLARAAEQHAT